MPSQSSDSARLHGVADALAPLREVSGEGAEETLALYVDLGEPTVQRALDTCLEQVADVLRALEGEAGEQVSRLLLASRQLGVTEPADVAVPSPVRGES